MPRFLFPRTRVGSLGIHHTYTAELGHHKSVIDVTAQGQEGHALGTECPGNTKRESGVGTRNGRAKNGNKGNLKTSGATIKRKTGSG